MHSDRIRPKPLLDKAVSAEEAARFIKNGMTIGMSGFTRAGEAKAVPLALAERAAHEELKITLMTGASLGNDLDKILTQAGVLARRLPFQSDPVLRRAINAGEVMFIDQHLSETVELLRSRQIGPIDIAVLEAVAITAEGGIIPTTSIGNSATFGILAKKVIIEINLTQPLALEGIHDVYIPTRRPFREPFPVVAPESRVGLPFIPIDPAKIVAIVVTKKLDSASTILPPECDIYGNINSTPVNGTHMMNGIGGSGDFARNASYAIFVTKSLAKNGNISGVVPMVTHVDHNEHDVDVIITEVGLADLRGLAPRERARVIIENCAHPIYRDSLSDYFKRALKRGGHTPHLLEEAFSWHDAYRKRGTMKDACAEQMAQEAPLTNQDLAFTRPQISDPISGTIKTKKQRLCQH
jgi:acyl-CoA hydrolase